MELKEAWKLVLAQAKEGLLAMSLVNPVDPEETKDWIMELEQAVEMLEEVYQADM